MVAGVAGIAAFAGAAVGGVWYVTGPDAAPPPSASAPVPAPTPEPARPPAAAPYPRLGAQTVAAPPPAPPNVYGPARIEPPKSSWEAVPVASRPNKLGPLGGAMMRALNELQEDISPCFDDATAARHGQEKVTTVKDAMPMDDQGATVLILQIEVAGDTARIVDAPVETRGGVSDGTIACAQRVLRGQKVGVPGSQKPGKYRMMYSLMP
jgi:hypothetical protein